MGAVLLLEDGRSFSGDAFGARATRVGEAVFNTAMTGYQEVLTDPSYAEQVVAMTAPHIGNTGMNGEDPESERIRMECSNGGQRIRSRSSRFQQPGDGLRFTGARQSGIERRCLADPGAFLDGGAKPSREIE